MTRRTRVIRTVAIAAGIGAASGLISYWVPTEVSFGIKLKPSALVVILTFLGPGIIYGLVLSVYLYWSRRAPVWRAAAFVPFVVISWYTALLWHRAVPYWFGHSDLGFWLKGSFVGLVGIVGMIAGLWLLFPFFRRVRLAAVTLLVGASLGSILEFDLDWPLVVYFVLWQAGVTACIGWAVARADEDAAPLKTPRR